MLVILLWLHKVTLVLVKLSKANTIFPDVFDGFSLPLHMNVAPSMSSEAFVGSWHEGLTSLWSLSPSLQSSHALHAFSSCVGWFVILTNGHMQLILHLCHLIKKGFPVLGKHNVRLQHHGNYFTAEIGNVAVNHSGYFAAAVHEALPGHHTKFSGYRPVTKLNMMFCQCGAQKCGDDLCECLLLLLLLQHLLL